MDMERKKQQIRDMMRRNERTMQQALTNPTSVHLAGRAVDKKPLTQMKEFSLSAPPTPRGSRASSSNSTAPKDSAVKPRESSPNRSALSREASRSAFSREASRSALSREASPGRGARSESCRRLTTPQAPDFSTAARAGRRSSMSGGATPAWTKPAPASVSPRRLTPERSRQPAQPGAPDEHSKKVIDESARRCRKHLDNVRAPAAGSTAAGIGLQAGQNLARARTGYGASSSTSAFLSASAVGSLRKAAPAKKTVV